MTQRSGKILVGILILIQGWVAGCSDTPASKGNPAIGELNLSLAAYTESGIKYRLRSATFPITSLTPLSDAGTPTTKTVSSEDNPNADAITVKLLEGWYQVRLQPGWHMERINPNGSTETVDATLLSSSQLYVRVTRGSSSSVSFQFGIGPEEIWLNGKLTISIQVTDRCGCDDDGGVDDDGGTFDASYEDGSIFGPDEDGGMCVCN